MLVYKEIERVIQSKNYRLKDFVPRVTELTIQGFKKSVENKNLKVSILEEISKALDLPMSFWWEEEDSQLLQNGPIYYGKRKEYEIKKLKKEIADQKETIKNLNLLLRRYTKHEDIELKKEKLASSDI